MKNQKTQRVFFKTASALLRLAFVLTAVWVGLDHARAESNLVYARVTAEIVDVKTFTMTLLGTERRHSLICRARHGNNDGGFAAPPREHQLDDHDPVRLSAALSGEEEVNPHQPCESGETCDCDYYDRFIDVYTPVKRYAVSYEWNGQRGLTVVKSKPEKQEGVTLRVIADLNASHKKHYPLPYPELAGKPQKTGSIHGLVFYAKPENIRVEEHETEIQGVSVSPSYVMDCGGSGEAGGENSFSCGACQCVQVKGGKSLILGQRINRYRVSYSFLGVPGVRELDRKPENLNDIRLLVKARPMVPVIGGEIWQ